MKNTGEPLGGIKVVNISLNLPGPAAAARLTCLGALVTKVEPPDGDPFEGYCPVWYEALRTNQTILRLDLKSAKGRDAMAALLEESDLFLTSFRPSVLGRLGFGWEGLHSRYPRLCQVAIVGYPAPDHNKPGHDLNYQASLGLLSPPALPRTLLADLGGAERAAGSAVALLLSRERGQGAGYAEVALSESAEYFGQCIRYGMTVPGAMAGGGWPCYNLYETAEGWIAVGALEAHFWQTLTAALGFDRTDVSYKEVQEAFFAKTAVEWETWAAGLDLPVVAVR